jgi:uncharacterized protein (TIGR03437 family)
MCKRPGAQFGCMVNVTARVVAVLAAVFGCLALSPEARAQNVAVIVTTQPPGANFIVDGLVYSQQQTFNWPVGSQHTLVIGSLIQPDSTAPQVFTFVNWTDAQGTFDTPTIYITASAAATQYTAVFSATETLTTAVSPIGAGTILGGCAQSAQYPIPNVGICSYGSTQTLTVTANPGFVFDHWTPGLHQTAVGGVDTISMVAPVTATANFLVAVPVVFDSVPEGLQVLVDTVPTTTPDPLPLGWGSTHSITAISPQKDKTGNYWVFSSWSDNGADTHTITVPNLSPGFTLLANFVPAAVSTFNFSPPNIGLSLTVDGRSNYTDWSFAWATGTTHTFSAPATQVDAQGNLWGFVSWSNGGTEAQTLTVTGGGTYTATYQQLSQLTVASTLPGVLVSVNGKACATPCAVQQPVNTALIVTAPASVAVGVGQRQDLTGWSNGTAAGNLTLPAPAKATTITANYRLMNQLTMITSPVGAATWNLQPASADGYFSTGTVVNISLIPAAGYQFRDWSGDLNGIEPFGTLVMTQPRTAAAILASVPYLPTGAVTNGAGVTPTAAVAPGSVISIFGLNLASTTLGGPVTPMLQTLGGVTVAVGSRLLPLYFVSPSQINAELPPDLATGASTLVVTLADGATVTGAFTIARDAPGLFSITSNNKTYALAFHQNGTLVDEGSPAQAGETITVYGTGFGPTSPARPEGLALPLTPAFLLTDSASVQVGGASFPASSAYALPDAVGTDAIAFTLTQPNTPTTAGDYALTVTVNSVVSNSVLLPIQ